MADPIRSDTYGSRPNREQVERAKVERQVKAGDRPDNINGAPRDTTRNTNVVRFGEVGERARVNNQYDIRNAYPDTAAQFADSYSKAGIQPSNITTEPKRTAAQQQQQNQIRAAQVQYETDVAESATNIPVVVRKKKPKPNPVLRELARVRAGTINASVMGAASALFLPVLVLAAVAIVAFGLASLVDTLIAESGNLNLTGFPSIAAGIAFIFFVITGIDILTLPGEIFFLAYLGSVGIGYMILLMMFIIYTVSLIHCLSGSHAHTKQIAFLISLIGHSVPFMNVFPWFLVWAVAVWLYPK